ncbi:class I SAM-dependent methyltransferase [Microlunatus flavus]|uniref:Methyltransferase domain-containing protein n=1 Tax=Microlunatus flavus TaxID=1036181 RepID=A0A1H9FU37_9ACTN|nr:class I SAM-dependent methyltransferase [Microlunatus flavus]SEQ41414.1 Methyltransferase domain-containing protein [Microlunatus flavus]
MPIDLYWDHNAWYQARILRALPADLGTVLDVGCGAGSFAVRLAARAQHVDAIDRAPHMIAAARERVPANVDARVEDMTTVRLPSAHYDAITSISAFHHVELTQVLPRLAEALRPGGLLVAVALPRTDLPRDLPVEAVSVAGDRLLGTAFRLEQVLTGRRRYAHEATVRQMPMQDPVLTTRQVREQAGRVLPDVRVRRLPFWRYELRWQRPLTPRS